MPVTEELTDAGIYQVAEISRNVENVNRFKHVSRYCAAERATPCSSSRRYYPLTTLSIVSPTSPSPPRTLRVYMQTRIHECCDKWRDLRIVVHSSQIRLNPWIKVADTKFESIFYKSFLFIGKHGKWEQSLELHFENILTLLVNYVIHEIFQNLIWKIECFGRERSLFMDR